MSQAGDEEDRMIRADDRAVENLRRVRAARREQPLATRVTPPEYAGLAVEPCECDLSCSECGCALECSEGTTCDVCHERICAHCMVSDTIPDTVAGHEVKRLRFRCPACVDPRDEPDTEDPDTDRQAAEVEA